MSKSTYNGSVTIKAQKKSRAFLGANPNRAQGMFYNNSLGTLYLNFDEAASPMKWVVKLLPNDYYELPTQYTKDGRAEVFKGAIFGCWASDKKGFCRVTELVN